MPSNCGWVCLCFRVPLGLPVRSHCACMGVQLVPMPTLFYSLGLDMGQIGSDIMMALDDVVDSKTVDAARCEGRVISGA